MRIIMLAGAALAAAATPAMAQDWSQSEDAPFSGVYVGAAGGYDVQPNDRGSSILFDRNLNGTFGEPVDVIRTGTGANAFAPGFCNGAARSQLAPAAGGSCRKDRDGWAYYGRVGMDHQLPSNIVVGAVGEFGRTEIRDSVTGFSSTPASYVMTRTVDWEASIRGRAGYAANRTLFYGTFGAGYARIDRDFASTQSTNTFTGRGRRNQFGFLGGGGIEQKITRNISLGMEYMYHQYQDNDYRVRVAGPAGTPFTNAATGGTAQGTDFRRSDDKFRWHSLRATAAFRF